MADRDTSPDESSEEDVWILYKDRSEWKDIKPIPQNDGPHPVVAIAYSEKFRDVYDYFRAILHKNEKSDRALLLTVDALKLNPANYTVWQYRRALLKDLGKDLHTELVYAKQMIEQNPKNYQVWHHRRVIVEWLQDPSEELELTDTVLHADAKNYHAWQHRQWALRSFSLFEHELQYVERLLSEDIRNNSAWNQRFFVIKHTTGFVADVIEREVAFTLEKITLATFNESAWNYLRGILDQQDAGVSTHTGVVKYCEELYAADNRSPYLLGFMVDVCEDQVERGEGDKVWTRDRALGLCDDLAKKYDTIRLEYWNYIARTLVSPAAPQVSPAAPLVEELA